MEKCWWDDKKALRMAGVWVLWGGVCWILGAVFAVLGVIGEAMNVTLGLGPVSWLMLAIAAFVASIPCYLGWAVGVYLHAVEAKRKERK